MTIGSLFSGIGGLELGLEWAGLGPVLWQVEIDPKCRNCLATHWPEAKRFEDVRTVGKAELEPVDLICGGFPCQDVSSAGKRVGLGGSRSGLWFEFARIVSELRPRFVVVENVASGATKWVDEVRLCLERIGYGSLPVPLSAADCGAWHERARVFLVAYRDEPEQKPERTRKTRGGVLLEALTDPHGDKLREQRRRIGRPHREEARLAANRASSDVNDKRQSRPASSGEQGRHWTCDGDIWAAEPDVARVVHGFPGRVDRERALGNSVVPQCAEVIGHIVRILEAA